MTENPFVGLLGEFRTAAATLDTRGFGVNVWWDFRPEFINPKRKTLGCCHLPYLADGEVKSSEFVLTVDVGRGLYGTRNCGLPFADLASRAGAALLQRGELCRELSVHVPAYVSETAPWWVVLLWKLAWDGPFPELLSETGEPTGRVPPMSIIRPFHASIHAIEVCKLLTDSPCLPETPHPMIAELAGATLWRQDSGGNLGDHDDAPKPSWDRSKGELSFDGETVRRIRCIGVAKNVVLVLDTFQELGWPDRVDSPLSPDRQKHHATISSLNTDLSRIRFGSDGEGKGFIWETR
jgi:hypothetical protein